MAPQEKREELTWMHVLVRVFLNSTTHPIEYAKVLIQLGHEPLKPYKSRTVFGREAFYYPSVFSYIVHIKNRDGFFGCYRGLGPKLTANIVSGIAFQRVTESIKFKDFDGDDVDIENLTMKERTQRFLQNTSRETAGRAAAILVSQPFHVIAVRCMAEFVGEEGQYTSVFTAVGIIYKEEGIKGFFCGLIPRLLCDLTALWLGKTLAHIINNYLLEDRDLKQYVSASMNFLASAMTYPLQVVSNCMAVSGSGLTAGSPPNMPIFSGWLDCYSHLRQVRGLKRGSSMLWRPFTGATVMMGGSLAIPTSSMFSQPSLS
ncbi:mitochondrial carrier homolog 2-like [Eriocheir sinensis]|uniref:mitochondrial carrier homolog 2-like n=1 Tax=Eriocheir sinensis TaxID=95602 RepID=UPI0021C831EA|nr:mitochondrial carrier homolog 2-like [Eriocheir sinensis]